MYIYTVRRYHESHISKVCMHTLEVKDHSSLNLRVNFSLIKTKMLLRSIFSYDNINRTWMLQVRDIEIERSLGWFASVPNQVKKQKNVQYVFEHIQWKSKFRFFIYICHIVNLLYCKFCIYIYSVNSKFTICPPPKRRYEW